MGLLQGCCDLAWLALQGFGSGLLGRCGCICICTCIAIERLWLRLSGSWPVCCWCLVLQLRHHLQDHALHQAC